MRYRNSREKGGKINEAERDVGLGALPRLPMHKYPIVHVHIYIANMQYIRTLKKRCALAARTGIQQTQEL